MKQYRFPENKFVTLCFPVVLLALQMVASSTMYTSTFLGFGRSQALMIGLVLAVGVAFLLVNRKHLKEIFLDRRMIAFSCAAVVVLLPMLVKQDWQLMYFTILLHLLFCFIL